MHGKYQHQRSGFVVPENVEIGYDFSERSTNPMKVARELHAREGDLLVFTWWGQLVLAV